MSITNNTKVGVIGSGAMGSGIAQVAAMAGHPVAIFDTNPTALEKSKANLTAVLNKLQEKGKVKDANQVLSRFSFVADMNAFADCGLVIEAIIENLEIKKGVFASLEETVKDDCILASNTSSLSIASIASACRKAERVIGIHFFNPAPLMALVEIIPAIQTDETLPQQIKELMLQWGKAPVIAKDTPGFIVNRVARPFYSEALRIYEEGIADMPTIDWALTTLAGFKMGPFTLMDYIGHDVNYVVTETVFASFYFDPRYKPAFAQKRLLEAGWLGRKTGRGFYNYAENAVMPKATEDEALGKKIVARVLAMLINEAVDAVHWNIASPEDIELAMTKGVNYPKGLLHWCDETGADAVLATLDTLFDAYHEDRYRASVLLRKMGVEGKKFF
ncbi:3-hydroxybutyryl-CoA dehydrogenase [Taibaiella lutea]|uniref:3-hydroxybutyryl-CoA dehydrogenase n=1 Tax=Taibaiella lutea TaxID=2608001 RepID=A0A5M6CJD0_9BACT|nr:3-hydroxyacyl-CoA dehydrogenase NAD-binding domain-containing protein [Taibaiella lutea]KAA5533465.1 3-hydroxybutyryl-CoA dehydrogenase [Taibaiella lutea]